MSPGGGIKAPPPPLPPDLDAFRKLVATCNKRPASDSHQKFVKKLDSIPSIDLPAKETCRSTMNLAERGIIGQFMGLWPSPKAVGAWVQRNWSPLVKEGIRSHLVGKGFFIFVFDNLEDRNLIFRNRLYFMVPQGLYLNKWSLYFDPTQDIPSNVPIWVCLPHLPLHYWNPKSLESIGNTLRKYIDKADRKEQYSCARICMEVDLEVGLSEAIQLKVAD
jgi:hypothetical protein